MELLKRRILEEGRVLSDQVLSVNTFLNHGVDPSLIAAMGRTFAERFRDLNVTRVLTIESSGIAIAYATAIELGVPLVFARRRKALMNEGEYFSERVPSFTKGIVTDIVISRELLKPDDRILFIDDFIANGDAARGLIRIVERSGATLVGAGIAIEKAFQPGGSYLRELGLPVLSLARIASLADGQVRFAED
ncbi:xanthine phosphoribosyltransferase [Paenibacillus sp.]|uniref:xanthine phosphoribosyltransferase n=1 Tax=Paenibacillus sp. TaxID=58172 RepID=UPI002D358A89|nr:xanthine phosphoribosyltransferase [Paenibacillus sp.]HZG88023.1 xanthine phosphoribosyltransferase [Paenibacillus sp.]